MASNGSPAKGTDKDASEFASSIKSIETGYNLSMIRKEFLQGALGWISRRLGLTVTAGLAAGLLASAAVIVAFAELADGVVEGESRRFDRSVLLWIHATFPPWLDGPMRLITALGYYWVVIPLLLVAVYALYRRGLVLSAALLAISTTGSIVLTTFLKAVFRRTRPELFQSDYTASFYSFPSGHATVAVGFYGTLAMLLALRLGGWKRWTVAGAGVALVLLIGFSRLYLGVHYPTDILAGYLSAALWVSTVGSTFLLWRTLRERKRRV